MCGRLHILLGSLPSEERGDRIQMGLFLRGTFPMEQGKALPVSCLLPGAAEVEGQLPKG